MSLRLSRLDLQAVPPRSVYLRNALMVMYSGCQNGGRQPGPRLVRVVARKTLVSGESLFLFLAVFSFRYNFPSLILLSRSWLL